MPYVLPFYKFGNAWWVKYLTVAWNPEYWCQSFFLFGQSLFSILQLLTHPVSLLTECSMEQLVLAVSSASENWSIFLTWPLIKEPFIWHDFMFFLNPANHIKFLSVILEPDINPGYIYWTITSFQLEKFQLKLSQYVYLYNLRKSVY